MLTSLLVLLLFSNALASRRDKSIMFSRIVIMSFFFASFLAYNNLHVKALESGIGLSVKLFNISITTQFLDLFILLVAINLAITLWLLFIYILQEWFDIVNIISLLFNN